MSASRDGTKACVQWKKLPLSAVCEKVSTIDPRGRPDDFFMYIDIASIDNLQHKIVGPKRMLGKDAPSRARQHAKVGDTLFSTVRPYLRNIALLSRELDGVVCSTGFCILRPSPMLHPNFLFRYVTTDEFIARISPSQTGTMYPAVKRDDIMAQSIPVPPYDEQQQIAARLESILQRTTTIRQELSRIPELTKRLRMTILSKAFRGELTARILHDEPADALLGRAIRNPPLNAEHVTLESFGPGSRSPDAEKLPKLPSQWLWAKLGHLLKEPLRNGRSAKPARSEDGVPALTLSAVTFKDFGLHNVKSCNLSQTDVKGLWVKNNDIFIARSNTADYVGMAAIYQGPDNQFIFPDLMIRVRVVDRCILPLYLAHYLDSPVARSYFMGRARSTAGSMPKIHQGHILNLPVPLAPYKEQQEVIHQLNAIASGIGQIEAVSTRTTVLLAMLEQSVLAKAFSGGLTGSGIPS